MKFENLKRNENQVTCTTHSPFIEWVSKIKARAMARQLRKDYCIPKTAKISYNVVINYEFNVEDNTYEQTRADGI